MLKIVLKIFTQYLSFGEKKLTTVCNKNFDKIVANFVKIEEICSKYGLFFPFKSQLNTHFKAGCTRMMQAIFFPST